MRRAIMRHWWHQSDYGEWLVCGASIGTEALFKIGESFISEQHLAEIIKDAQALIDKALNA